MAVKNSLPTITQRRSTAPKSKLLARQFSRFNHIFKPQFYPWLLCFILTLYIIYLRISSHNNTIQFHNDISQEDDTTADTELLQSDDLVRARLLAAQNNTIRTSKGSMLGNHFCILQPTLSAGRQHWSKDDARRHIALRAFMRTFITTVTKNEQKEFKFSIYYGHDSDDPVFGTPSLRSAFEKEAKRMLSEAGFPENAVNLIFTPLYGLHSRINAIWNVLAKDAYYDGCDYFFLSNDDMVFFTKGWVSRSRDSLNGLGSPIGRKRPCRYFGIVRFKDMWASWATFTFHVSTRMHLEIFGGVYYPVPYNSAHNDYWINYVYRHFEASKYRGEIQVRNRVDDVDYALAHPTDTTKIAPPRYDYDKIGNARKYIDEGRARVDAWLARYKHTDRCQKPL